MNAHIRQTERKNSSHFAIWIALILLIMVNFSTSTNMINFSLSSSTVQTALRYSRSELSCFKSGPGTTFSVSRSSARRYTPTTPNSSAAAESHTGANPSFERSSLIFLLLNEGCDENH